MAGARLLLFSLMHCQDNKQVALYYNTHVFLRCVVLRNTEINIQLPYLKGLWGNTELHKNNFRWSWMKSNFHNSFLKLYVPCIMFQCVDKPTRCNTSYEWSLLSIIWLYLYRTINSPSSGASSHKLYNALICVVLSGESAASPDSTNIPMRYTVYEMMLLMMDCW